MDTRLSDCGGERVRHTWVIVAGAGLAAVLAGPAWPARVRAAEAVPVVQAAGVAAPGIATVHTKIRHMRDSIDSAASLTRSAARRMGRTARNMQYNRIGAPAQVTLLTRNAVILNTLARQPTGATMPVVRGKLGAVLYGTAGPQNIISAGQDQHIVIMRLDEVLKDMQALAAGRLAQNIDDILSKQKSLKDATGKLFKQTLGISRAKLSQRKQSQLSHTAKKQQSITRELRQVAKALEHQAQSQSQKGHMARAKEYQNILKTIEHADVSHLSRRAGTNIKHNELGKAMNQQEAIINALQHAHNMLQPHTMESESALYQKLNAVEELARQEQGVLGQTQQMHGQGRKNDFHSLQGKQSAITHGIGKQHIQPAMGPSQKAEHALGKGQSQQAAGHEAKTLAALNNAAEALRKQLGMGPPGNMPGHHFSDKFMFVNRSKTHSGLSAVLKYGAGRGPRTGSSWNIGLTKKDQRTLQTVAAQHFPARYRAALEAYYESLAATPSNRN